MNKEELLAKAKKDYPIGTVFYPINTGRSRTITTGDFRVDYNGHIHEYKNDVIIKDDIYNCIYDGRDKTWSQVISKSKTVGKLLGYKIKDSNQEDAIIAYFNKRWNAECTKGNFPDGTWLKEDYWVSKAKRDNILDLWFEPVYQQLITAKKGDHLYCIKSFSMAGTSDEVATKGKVYFCSSNNNFVDNDGDNHGLEDEFTTEYFRIATPDEVEDSKKIKIEGYAAEFDRTGVAFGCTGISKKQLQYFCDVQKSMKKMNVDLPNFQVTKSGFLYKGRDVTKQVTEVFKHFKIK